MSVIKALALIVVFLVSYSLSYYIDEKYFSPYRESLKKYSDISTRYGEICKSKGLNTQYKKYQQIHLPKTDLDEIFKLHPEKISIRKDRIIYTLSEYDCYTILLPSRKDYNSFVKYFNKYTNTIKEKEEKIIEEKNINKVLDDAYDVVR